MLIGGVLGMIANALSGVGQIVDIPASAIAVLIIPGGTTYLIWKLSLRSLPPNFFVYVWGCGFFGAAIGIMVTATVVTTLLWLSDLYSLDYLLDFYFPYALMQTFPEGFITGTVLSLLVIYQPEWAPPSGTSFTSITSSQVMRIIGQKKKPQTSDQPGAWVPVL